jgi:hypothetical protein
LISFTYRRKKEKERVQALADKAVELLISGQKDTENLDEEWMSKATQQLLAFHESSTQILEEEKSSRSRIISSADVKTLITNLSAGKNGNNEKKKKREKRVFFGLN